MECSDLTKAEGFQHQQHKIGGQPENPPLMISSMFHNKDKIVQDRKGNFDRQRAVEIIRKQEELAN
jgi:tetrahydromethanopterin S-methyltransferase subunit H